MAETGAEISRGWGTMECLLLPEGEGEDGGRARF